MAARKSESPSQAPGHRRLPIPKKVESNTVLTEKMTDARDRFSRADRIKIRRTNQRRQMNGRR